MTNSIRFYICLTLLLLSNTLTVSGKNNQYNISDDYYGYVRRFKTSDIHSSIKIADSLYQKALAKEDKRAECVALILFCDYYYYNHDLKNLLNTNKRVRNLCLEINDKELMFEPWTRVISYYLNLREFSKAYLEMMNFQQEALKMNSKEGTGMAYRNLGNFYQVQNNHKLAIEQYKKGGEYYLGCKEYHKVFLFYCSVAFSSLNYDTRLAAEYSDKALKLAPKYGKSLVPILYKFAVATKENNMQKADSLLHEINNIKGENALVGSNREVYFKYLIIYYLNKKNLPLAKQYIDSLRNDDNIYSSKGLLAQAEGDYKTALHFMTRRFEYNDSATNQFGQNLLAGMVSSYTYTKLETENAQLRLHTVVIRFVFGFIVLAIIVVALFIYVYYRRLTIKKLRKEQIIAEEARHNAEKADNLKTVFLQNMSHEIRTPLNAIIGFTDLLNDQDENTLSDKEREEFKQIIHSNSQRLLTLINDILDLSKLESGNYSLKYEDVNINGLCYEVASSLQSYVPEGVELKYEPCKGYEDIIAHIDGQRVGQIITNFLTNACKYTSQGEIRLTYQVMPIDNSKLVELKFSVTDTGTGIPKEKQEAIFQRFEKLNSNKPGSGIGLNISLRLARLMNGYISIDPDYNDGSRFYLTIPAITIKAEKVS